MRQKKFPDYSTSQLRELAHRSNLSPETRRIFHEEVLARDAEALENTSSGNVFKNCNIANIKGVQLPALPVMEGNTFQTRVQEYELWSREGGCFIHVGSILSCLNCLAGITGDAPLREILAAGWHIRVHHG